MHLIKNKVITFVVALVLSVPALAQFKINEYSCANVSGLTDFTGGTPDWFEIYNTNINPKSIAGWYVSDDPTYAGKWQFPINTTIPGKGFLLVFASGLDTVTAGGEYHTNFDLLQTMPEYIVLSDNNGIIKDSLKIRRHQHNHAWGRVPNGSGTWKVFARNTSGGPTATPGATNTPVTPIKSYKGYLPPPIVDPPRGFYSPGTQVTLTIPSAALVTNPDALLYYFGAPDGSGVMSYAGQDPSADYAQQGGGGPPKLAYDGSFTITVDSSTVLRAYLDTLDQPGGNGYGYLPSFVETHSYIIDQANVLLHDPNGLTIQTQTITLPVISIGYDTVTTGTYPGQTGAGIAHNAMTSLEYFDKGSSHPFKFGTVGITTPGTSDDAPIPGFYVGYDYSAYDEYGYSYTNKQQLYTNSSLATSPRTEQTTISLKAAGSDNYPFTMLANPNELSTHLRGPFAETYGMKNNLDLDGSHYSPCIMYINGKYFGIYDIREKFDLEYTKFYYGAADSVQSLEMDAVLNSSSLQATNDWTSLVNFITSNNMQNDSLRHIADSLLSFGSLIDLIIYNGYTVNTVFPQKAAWWRAPDSASGRIKWRYRYFDFEDTYGLGENVAALPSTNYDASTCQAQASYGSTTTPDIAHLAIFTSLMASDTFKSQFINRYSYLLNTSLRCPPIISYLNYVKSLLSPEIPQHTIHMAGPFPGLFPHELDTMWSYNVDTIKYWINQRCPTITEDIKTCYNVTGPWSFCTDVDPKGSGTVMLNNVGYPDAHSDTYFGNVYFDAIGVPNENYVFDHWELSQFTLPDSLLHNDSLHWLFDSTSCIKAIFKLKQPYQTVGEPAVPTGFSPNGDGTNDLLNVYGTRDVTNYEFAVYNRWGQKIWESTDKTKGWDGTYNGQEASVGVYAYVFKVTTVDGKQIQKSGNITLIR